MNPFNRLKTLSIALVCLFIVQGCTKTDASQAQSETSSENGDVQLFSAAPNSFAGSHILVAFQGADRADSSITRTKEEALEKAKDLVAQLTADPSKFEDLAKEHSDGPSGERGGDLGSWQKGRMVPEFDNAIEQMEIGDISAEPVETGFGYHVMRRNDARVAYYGARGFIIGTTGHPQVPPTITRDSAASATLAEEIKTKVTDDNFEELALEYNDFADGSMFIGPFKDGDPVAPEIFDAIKGLDIGEISEPVQLPVGLAFMKRIKLEQRAGAHILISYSGAESDREGNITRTKEEAKAEAERLTGLAKDNPEGFADLAKEHSDGPSGPSGGDLGVWFKGQMVPAFDDALDTMDVGDISDAPVETPYGFHVIIKNEVDL